MASSTATASTRTPTISADYNQDQNWLVLTFADNRVLRVEVAALSPTIIEAATVHGLKQKLVDAAAIARNTETGLPATLADKYNAVKEVYDRITAPDGTWNAVRGNGEAASTGGQLLRALVRLQGVTTQDGVEAIKAKMAGWDAKQKAAVRANPRVKAILDEMAAESAKASGVDGDELLATLGD